MHTIIIYKMGTVCVPFLYFVVDFAVASYNFFFFFFRSSRFFLLLLLVFLLLKSYPKGKNIHLKIKKIPHNIMLHGAEYEKHHHCHCESPPTTRDKYMYIYRKKKKKIKDGHFSSFSLVEWCTPRPLPCRLMLTGCYVSVK